MIRSEDRALLSLVGTPSTGTRPPIVVDIGRSHHGDFSQAARLIGAAHRGGADGVKLPAYRTERCLQFQTAAEFARWKRNELRYGELRKLSELAGELGLQFVVAALDVESVEQVADFATRFKVGSADNDFLPLLHALAATGKPIVMSTGGSDLDRIGRSVDAVMARWGSDRRRGDLTLLHTVCEDPTPASSANLRAITSLQSRFGLSVGYADHCEGIESCVLAVGLGATWLEKPFNMDAAASGDITALDPQTLPPLVERVSDAYQRSGSGRKRVQDGERPMLLARRRSIVAARELPLGHVIALSDLTWIRPANGLPPGCEPLLLGAVLRRPVSKGEPVQLEDIQCRRAA